MRKWLSSSAVCRFGNGAIIVGIGLVIFLIPGIMIIGDLFDYGLSEDRIPRCAWRWHRSLTPKYGRWARERVADGSGAGVAQYDIAGTEWPIFGSVFYLWATESLQAAWERDNSLSSVAPNVYAKETIESTVALVLDPNHAAWVKKHWGEDYLTRENCFYRMLLISAMTSHAKLTGSTRYVEELRTHVDELAKDIDESPVGLIEDYPGECYPCDVIAAIWAINEADKVLGTDHSAFVERSLRGFTGDRLDATTGLPPYDANARTGKPSLSRGCGNSYATFLAPDLWPETARQWFAAYEKHFWQYKWTAYGFREFDHSVANRDWYADVDAGPVIAGHGIAACAFGVASARKNGRYDMGYPLAAEALVVSWPLPDGTLLGPRILSNAVDAPYLGEACMIFNMTRTASPGVDVRTGGGLSGFVWILLVGYFAMGLGLPLSAWWRLRRWRTRRTDGRLWLGGVQPVLWGLLIVGGCVLCMVWSISVGAIMVLSAQLLPIGEKLNPRKMSEESEESASNIDHSSPNAE
jgi:hypothetical protein